MLKKLTRNLFWFDLVFGLLEGWWLFDDGREHALASESLWKQALHTAGFRWVDWSDSGTKESDILRVITASPYKDGPSETVSDTISREEGSANSELRQTLTYKILERQLILERFCL